MDTFIKNNPNLSDIATIESRKNMDMMVDFLCASKEANITLPLIPLKSVSFWGCHDIVAQDLYSDENAILANIIIQNYSEIQNGNYIGGSAITHDIADDDTLLRLSSRRFYSSVGYLEYELIHILQAINGNNPEFQYTEVLSIFGKLVTMELLSRKFANPDIYVYEVLSSCQNMIIQNKFFARDFEDENYEKSPWKASILSSYQYMLGFIYAIRLFELYHLDPEKILDDFNSVLIGQKNLRSILGDYHISLEDEDTINCFLNMVDSYRSFIDMKCNEAEVAR